MRGATRMFVAVCTITGSVARISTCVSVGALTNRQSGGLTWTERLPEVPLTVAAMVAGPAAADTTCPDDNALRTLESEDVQVAVRVSSSADPSDQVAVAV